MRLAAIFLSVALPAFGQTVYRLGGQSVATPENHYTQFGQQVASFADSTINTSATRHAACGPIWTPNAGSKSISKVIFRFGSVTKTGGTDIQVSLQDVNTTGSPTKPDNTVDQSYTILDSDSGYAANTQYTATLDATRSITAGDMVCVVWQPISYGGSDSIGISHWSRTNEVWDPNNVAMAQTTDSGTTWVETSQRWSNVLFEFDDGTFGGFVGMQYYQATGSTTAFNSGSAADEIAMKMTFPYDVETDGAMVTVRVNSTSATYDIVLYQGTTAIDTVTVNPFLATNTSSGRLIVVHWGSRHVLSANTAYYLAVKPTSANSVNIYYNTVSAAGHLDVNPGGQVFHLASRVDAGSWSATTTQRLHASLLVSGVQITSGTSGGAFIIAQ